MSLIGYCTRSLYLLIFIFVFRASLSYCEPPVTVLGNCSTRRRHMREQVEWVEMK